MRKPQAVHIPLATRHPPSRDAAGQDMTNHANIAAETQPNHGFIAVVPVSITGDYPVTTLHRPIHHVGSPASLTPSR
jgi:hypothetical protein